MSPLTARRRTGPLVTGDVGRYAVVRDIAVRADRCALIVEEPDRTRRRLTVACAPDPGAVADLRSAGLRPLALRMDVDATGLPTCVAVCTSADGPQRHRVSLAGALALCADGLHALVTRRD
jgi:hypothetical protein